MQVRMIAAIVTAALVVILLWAVTQLDGLISNRPSYAVVTALFVSTAVWTFIINQLEVSKPKEYALAAIQYRPLLVSIGLFIVLAMLWVIARALVEWAVEPNIYDNGPCGRFNYESCGEEDLNADRRLLATSLVDRISAAILLIVPIILAVPKIRRVFQ